MLAPWRDLSTWEPKGFGVTRPTLAEDVDHMCAIARKAFRTDRFHRDLRFDRAAADRVYEKWVRSWHADPSPGRYSRVLLLDGDVAGFFMFELVGPSGEAADSVARIVLNGIEPSAAGAVTVSGCTATRWTSRAELRGTPRPMWRQRTRR